jgi:hypothetical protein
MGTVVINEVRDIVAQINDYLKSTPCPPNLFGIVTGCNVYLWPYDLGSNLTR